jgi:hypothetical protein
MRACCLLLLAPLIAGAQFPSPEQTGVVLERDSSAAGEFAIRAPDNQVYRYQFTEKTSVERDTLTGNIGHLRVGDQVSVQSDPVDGSLLRYARAIRVLSGAQPPALPDSRLRPSTLSFLDRTTQTANLTFTGVVARCTAQTLVLHTRTGDQTLLIRHDTRYVDNGDTVEAAKLQPNMRVFVRAGKNLYEQVEAYQVIWGQILEPVRK